MEYNYAVYPIIPDSVNEIAEEVRTFSERFDFVPQNSIVVGVFEKNDVLPSPDQNYPLCRFDEEIQLCGRHLLTGQILY